MRRTSPFDDRQTTEDEARQNRSRPTDKKSDQKVRGGKSRRTSNKLRISGLTINLSGESR